MLLPLLTLMLGGCYDDTFDINNGEYPDGETEIQCVMDFQPFRSDATTRAHSGNLLDKADDLCLVAYDLDGNLMDGFPVEITKEDHGLSVTTINRVEGDGSASNDHPAQNTTQRAGFRMKLPYGKYYLYGIANLGQRDDSGNLITTTCHELSEGAYRDRVTVRDSLLNTRLNWNREKLYSNSQMLGFFAVGETSASPRTAVDTYDKTVIIDKPSMKLHCWLRRSAAKVTVDFDGSNLLDNVKIYVKRVTLHDIPTFCFLGRKNAIHNANDLYPGKTSDETDGGAMRPDNSADYIDYGEGNDHTQWPSIANGKPALTKPDGTGLGDLHSESAPAMYLFENMQGEGEEHDVNNKNMLPVIDKPGDVAGKDDVKDKVEFGSYIEVEAYYTHVSSSYLSQGKIIYRFMLGRDALNNFDVERNHHFKITMCPRGYGNDVDWHIEYTEDSGFEYHDPYYVSYLYNHESTLRFRYKPASGEEIDYVTAEIVANNWWPDEDGNGYAKSVAAAQDPEKSENQNYKGTGKTRYLGNGFLSLRATNDIIIPYNKCYNGSNENFYRDNRDHIVSMNDNYFYGWKNDGSCQEDPNVKDRSYRKYEFTIGDNGEGLPKEPVTDAREDYKMEVLDDGSWRFNLPVFTRAKNLVIKTGYTGNNPFEYSSRTARVKVTLHMKNGGTPRTQILRVLQVPRITNPKGIYRRSGNNENFHVRLTQRKGDNGTEGFCVFNSDGPWMAEVLGDQNFININGKSMIKGASESPIDFTVRFNKMNRDDKIRNAVIRIRYNNYTCVHLIFVRQGYTSQAIEPSGTEWHTTNVAYYDATSGIVETEDPRDEGSLFKFGNISHPIDVKNNIYNSGAGVAPAMNAFRSNSPFYMAKSDLSEPTDDNARIAWDATDFQYNESGFDDNTEIATMQNLQDIYYKDNVEKGFGILYADGATETQTTIDGAYGYYRHERPVSERNKKGMSGIFIYYWDKKNHSVYDYRSLFLPIGRSTFGHRRHVDDMGGSGTLRYSCGRTGEFPTDHATLGNMLERSPLFYDLYRRPGAIYYGRKRQNVLESSTGQYAGDDSSGIDINFFNFDINVITANANLNRGQDACFLRCVGYQYKPGDAAVTTSGRQRRKDARRRR